MLDVTFLAHSGFLVDDGKRCYVFDYYKDPNNIVWQLAKRGRELCFLLVTVMQIILIRLLRSLMVLKLVIFAIKMYH